ncbi:MAG: hypothetical protein K2X44_07145 [Magnetospirillum sp.]|nr:hypothetical protein [Magnetospirillum sp.]
MRKLALIGGGVVVAVALIAVVLGVFVFSSLDGLVKKAIETVGSQVAGVPLKVSEVKIALTEGKASIKGLSVGNPKGFTSATAFKLGEIAVSIDTGSVTGNPVVIKEIVVASPEVTYELGGQGSNLDALQRNLAGSGGDKADKAPASSDDKSAKKLVIDRLALTGGTVNLATPIPGGNASGKLGDIVLTGIGRNSGGASAEQVAAKVLDALVKASLKAAQGMGIGGAIDGVAKKASDAVPGGATTTLKGVFGK